MMWRQGRTRRAFGSVVQHKDAEGRVPATKLTLPVFEGGHRCDDHCGRVPLTEVQASQETNQLDSLAQAHFVPHDPCAHQ